MKSATLLQLCFFAASLTPCLHISAQEWSGVHPAPGCIPRADGLKVENYRSWIQPYAKRSRKGRSGNKQDIEVSLTLLDGDNLAPDRSSGRTWLCGSDCCQMHTTYFVSSDGTFSMTRVTPMAVQGGGPDRFPAEKVEAIQKLLRILLPHPPDDHSSLPPRGRRLVLHIESSQKTVTRVYDRADIPASVQEVLGLIGATTGPMWLDFEPSVRKPEELGRFPIRLGTLGLRGPHPEELRTDAATLAISPDRSMIVTRYLPYEKVLVTSRDGKSILFAVSDYVLDRRMIYVSHAFFSPDSRFLLLLSNLPAIYVYDTTSWQSVDMLRGLPSEAIAFYPSSDWRHGVVVLRSGQVDAWDVSKGQKQSDLDLQGDLQDVSFSEDDSLFAVSSVRLNEDSSSTFHLRVWDTSTGQFLREMIPPYYFEHDEMSRPMWWDHGKYLLADIRAGHWGGYMIAIWNVQSGQLRGGFSGCDHSEDPYAVGIDGTRLLKWCRDYTLLVWDVPAAVEKITEFERTLPSLHNSVRF